jgi:hypothetical protein
MAKSMGKGINNQNRHKDKGGDGTKDLYMICCLKKQRRLYNAHWQRNLTEMNIV